MTSSPSTPRLRVVVAEDSAVLRMCIIDLLGAEVDVTEVADGAELRVVLERERFDLVISDIRMPQVSGVEVLRARRRAGDDTPFILISGSPLRKGELEGLCAAYFLDKPFSHETLVDAVARAIGRVPSGMRRGECP